MSDRDQALQDRLVFPEKCPCANVNSATGKQCHKVGTKACSNCYLVLYCSKECQKSHWKQHKTDCKSELMKTTWRPSWEAEQRKPAFVSNVTGPADKMVTYGKKKYLWGNVPALDMLGLAHNEGATYAKDLRLLFAASGDLRHVVKTIAGITSTSAPISLQDITAVINDRDFDIVARNAILLLTALHVVPAPAAAAAMIHTWYSALLPPSVLKSLHSTVLPLIRTVCAKIASKPPDQLLGKTFTHGRGSVRLVLTRRCWEALQAYLEVPSGLTAAEAKRVRGATVAAPARRDYVDRALFCQPPAWRAATIRFRSEGVLMPFGAATGTFDVPNPTMFQERDAWPMHDSADPLAGWAIEDALRKTPLAKNDLYGGLFFHISELLVDFCEKVQRMKISFVLLHVDAVDLPKSLANDFNLTKSFDRIEVSNIADGGYLGSKCLDIFAPLLRPLDENPCATLVTLFINAVTEVQTNADMMDIMMREMKRVVAVLPPVRQSTAAQSGNADSIRRLQAFDLFRDFDSLWTRYEQRHGFDGVAEGVGLRAKSKHTITEPWPMRLKKGPTKAEFERLLGSSHTGGERYVEWQRVR
ncbi:hypothetical protein GTA08_BOTSDO13075 [Botryosphaeria dothidea]|uniref:MYND-type domain-containing protein n=1 Tax=Botryosphaeria dothidea TaxID=55169 RepID=A0A8H4J219_9PEZI|nr:hypothetical protein GTA08_BOTSDO13075 [Botryosphaeria dothidea]